MKKVIRCVAFALLIGVITVRVFDILSWKDTTDNYVSSTEMLYGTDKDLIDAVFLGSSHTYCTIYPSVMWNSRGISGFDMSVSGQDRWSAYYSLKEVLKTQSPKVVFAEMYTLLYDRAPQEWMVYRNVLSLKPSLNSKDHVEALIDEEERGDYNLRFPIIHTRYRELQKYDFINNPQNEYLRGECLGWHIESGLKNPQARFEKDVIKLNAANQKWLDDLRALSEEEGFKLVFYLAPYSVTPDQQKMINASKEYAEKYGIDFYDFNLLSKELDVDWSHDMLDVDHTNGFGATKISLYLADILADEYGLPDHRGDSAYSQWDLDYKKYVHSYMQNCLESAGNVPEYLDIAKQISDVAIYISVDGEFGNIVDWIEKLGISAEELGSGGKWLWKNGVLTKLMDNSGGTIVCHEYSRFDNVIVQCIPDNTEANLLVNGETVTKTANGVNILVYDTFENKVLGTNVIDN